jgi:flagellar basal-body rod modification protein FlgD
MMLLVEQLKNQDPLEPMDSTDFTAQLAQFSSLEQQTQTNDNLELLQDYSATLNRLSALNMIDREVEYSGQGEGSVKLSGDGGPAPLAFNLADNAQQVTVEVYNESGGRVATLNLGYYDLGNQVYNWNGRDSQGESLPAGNYTYKVRAADEMGQSVQTTVDGRGLVQGVATDPQTGNTVLILDNGSQVGIDQVVAVNNV